MRPLDQRNARRLGVSPASLVSIEPATWPRSLMSVTPPPVPRSVITQPAVLDARVPAAKEATTIVVIAANGRILATAQG